MAKIASVDLMIADIIVEDYDKNGRLEQYFEKNLQAKPGDRLTITKKQFDELAPLISHRHVALCRGGTTATTLETLGRLSKGETKHDLIGVMGEGAYSKIVEGSFEGSGVQVHKVADGKGETAVSFVLRYPKKENKPPIIVTYPGNAKELINPSNLPKEKINGADVLYIQGSMRNRLDGKVMDKLLEWRRENNDSKQKLVVALPDTAFEDSYDWKKLTASADVVLSNIKQLKNYFGHNWDSIGELRKHMVVCNRVLKDEFKHPEGQIAFIMDEDRGAWVVTAENFTYVKATKSENKLPHPLGVEDTAYAGFLAGYFAKLPPEQAGQLAMNLAAAKQEDEWPSLADPRMALNKSFAGPTLLNELDRYLEGKRTYVPQPQPTYQEDIMVHLDRSANHFG